MRLTVRGWGRDMGETEIASNSILYTEFRTDGTVHRDKPVMYSSGLGITVAWYQELKLTGNYRMDLNLSETDIMKLFKAHFGSEIQPSTVKRFGLSFSPELVKSMLKTVKLTDLTLGELVGMANQEDKVAEPEKAEKQETVTPVRPFRRSLRSV